MGLAYDAAGLPPVAVHPHPERIPVSGGYTSYPIRILRECATVEEVIAWVGRHQWHSSMRDQMQFADATGDGVIVSAGVDGEVAFSRKPGGDGYLVATNFNVADPANGYEYPCVRYQTAQRLLRGLVEGTREIGAIDVAGVLDAVHQEGVASWTVSSLVADLPNRTVYLYYFFQFDKPVVLHVRDEIAHPRAEGQLSALFPEEVRREAARRYRQMQARTGSCRVTGQTWLGLVLAGLLLLVALSAGRGKGLRFWMPVVASSGRSACWSGGRLVVAGSRAGGRRS
jgi:hypothetical protein